ncbi:13236_t:CDS:1, partial [Funneliformis geosporum]
NEKETPEVTPAKTTTTLDVNTSFDTSEKFLDNNTTSAQTFE